VDNFTNFARSTLQSSITNVATSATLVDASSFPTTDFYIVAGNDYPVEIMHVASRSANVLTIDARGTLGTTAAAHNAGVKVVHTVLAHNFLDFQDTELLMWMDN
jgi:hypothetical protein